MKLKHADDKKNEYQYFILGMLIGFISFILIYGIKVLNVTYDHFLINQRADLTQNYLGWVFYRFSSGNNMPGMMNTLTFPNSISLIYTDSIPLIEIFLKPISRFLSPVFQYWGWWGAISMALSGGIAALIIKKWNRKLYVVGMCVLPFVLATPVIIKMWVHHTFAAQWILLLAYYIWINHKSEWDEIKWYKILGIWCGMGILACSIHFYFVPMVGIILVGYVFNMILADKKRWKLALSVLLVYVLGAISFMAVFGGFATDFYQSSTYFDEYIEALRICGANLNCFINSWTPTRFGELYEFALAGQGEGLAYLGAGMFVAILTALAVRLRYFANRKCTALKISMMLVFILSVIVGIGPVVTWGKTVLFEIPYPRFMLEIWSTFRNTGRFIWPAFYLLLLFAVKTLLTIGHKKIMAGIMIGCCMLQVVDLFPTFVDRHKKYAEYEEVETRLVDEAWNIVGRKYEHAVVLPNELLSRGTERNDFGYWAGKYSITLNDFYLARQVLEDQTDKILEIINAKQAKTDTVYIVTRDLLETFIDCPLYWYQLDDFYIGTVEDISLELNKKFINPELVKSDKEKWIWCDVDYALVFDPVYYYYKYYGDLMSKNMTEEETWKDFLDIGRYHGRAASINFDPMKYRERYIDVKKGCGDNWEMYYWHFACYGEKEGRKGNYE